MRFLPEHILRSRQHPARRLAMPVRHDGCAASHSRIALASPGGVSAAMRSTSMRATSALTGRPRMSAADYYPSSRELQIGVS